MRVRHDAEWKKFLDSDEKEKTKSEQRLNDAEWKTLIRTNEGATRFFQAKQMKLATYFYIGVLKHEAELNRELCDSKLLAAGGKTHIRNGSHSPSSLNTIDNFFPVCTCRIGCYETVNSGVIIGIY